ncbi:hypothetical protein BN1708_003952, partial [Verticillium longisporum]
MFANLLPMSESQANSSETSRAGNHVPNEATSITAETPPSPEALTPPGSTTPSLTMIMSTSTYSLSIYTPYPV